MKKKIILEMNAILEERKTDKIDKRKLKNKLDEIIQNKVEKKRNKNYYRQVNTYMQKAQ